jgi:hypothetical protein
MPTPTPSLSGLDDRDKRLVKAWCWVFAAHDLGVRDHLLREYYDAMSAHARCRCQQWQQRYQRAQGEGDANL